MSEQLPKKDSRRLMQIGNRLSQASKIVMISMVTALIVFGLFNFNNAPVMATALLICGGIGTAGF